MIAFWMCELAPTEVAAGDAWNNNQSACHRQFTRARPRKVGRTRTSRGALRVLVIDADRDAADSIAESVSRWGHAVTLAYDGPTALKAAAVQHQDVVLLDVDMPLMDGRQVARQLRRDYPGDKSLIIGVASRADEQCHQRCWEAGIDLVLVKPVLPSVIETLLMLEAARTNRLQADTAAVLASQGASRRSRTLLSDEQNGAARTARGRRAAKSASAKQPKRGATRGGGSC